MSGEKKVVDLMAALEASLERAKAAAAARLKRTSCVACHGSGWAYPDVEDAPPGANDPSDICYVCNGTGWAG